MLPLSQIINTIEEYQGRGWILVFYGIALVALFFRENDRGNRIAFLYLPALWFVIFLLPPVHSLYVRIDGNDTYYRLLWLIPMIVTIGYALVRQFADHLYIGVILLCAVLAVSGTCVYKNENLTAATNPYHLPQYVVDVCDAIMEDTGGERTMVAMPPEMVQFVRQYETRIMMPYGREMLMPSYANVEMPVYDIMNQDTINGKELVAAIRDYNCNYIVVSSIKIDTIDLSEYGIEFVGLVDGFAIYHDPTESASLTD